MQRRSSSAQAYLSLCAACVLWLLPSALHAQPATFPARPIRMIVTVAAGGPTDLLARLMSPRLTESLGQQVIVDNRAGGNGNIGMDIAARAQPDGHTWLLATASQLTVSPSLYKKLPFDTQRDFAPISVCVSLPSILITHPASSIKSVGDLIREAKAGTAPLIYATAGSGSPSHLAAELLREATGNRFTYVHYKGGAPAMMDVMSAQAQLTIIGLPTVVPHVRAGRLRSIGVTTLERLPFAPELATLHESGLPGFEVINWLAMLTPARTADAITTRINREVVNVLSRTAVRDTLSQQGFTPVASTAAELATRIRMETARWAKIVARSGLTAD